MLKFDAAWRFESPGTISRDVESGIVELIGKIASPEDPQ
jgi:hypothetical protein